MARNEVVAWDSSKAACQVTLTLTLTLTLIKAAVQVLALGRDDFADDLSRAPSCGRRRSSGAVGGPG